MIEATAAEGERDVDALRRLYPLYLHDLAGFTDHYTLDEDARWTPSYLEDWLARPVTHSLLIRVDGARAGFALVAEQPFPHMPAEVDFHLAEFFVATPYRRRGVGRAGALSALSSFRGSWNLSIVERNQPALAFWRSVLEELTGGDYAEVDGEGELSHRFSVA